MDEETLQRREKAIHEAIELLERVNDILGCLTETEIPELIIKIDKEAVYPVCG